jgi:hypothetical protein
MISSNEVPVVIFVYKRLETLKKLIKCLIDNKESPTTDLIFFSDGPKNSTETTLVEQVREYILTIQGFKSITLEINLNNHGLANSILEGVSKVFLKYEKAIFLEDDNFVSKNFIFFMRSALDKYEEIHNIGCISGFSYPTPYLIRKPYFLLGAETWSFATWRRVWNSFEKDAAKLKSIIDDTDKKKVLNMYGFDFYKMLEMQINNEIDSWGIRWWANAVCKDLLCLYPVKPHCVNIGWGPEGTHIQGKTRLLSDVSNLETRRNFFWPSKFKASPMMHIYLKAFNFFQHMKADIYLLFIAKRGKG